jgi:FdhD protein
MMKNKAIKSVQIQKHTTNGVQTAEDFLAVEEPLEIRIEHGAIAERKIQNLSITMRTPGNDADLVAGFLFTEGIIRQSNDLLEISVLEENVVLACLNPNIEVAIGQMERHFYTSSSCGVCGKTSIEAVKTAINCAIKPNLATINAAILLDLPTTLRKVQSTFEATGGIHAAAIFDLDGHLLALREDVGRHNALDKVIGYFVQQNQVPLEDKILLLSGRVSFELVQKAAMAGISTICAVGAPSSLAIETAVSFGIQIIGFLREGRFNVYHKSVELTFSTTKEHKVHKA